LVSYCGRIGPAMQIGELVRKRGMLTFVPGDRTCVSACATIWVAGKLRTVGDTPQIGFHAAYDEDTGRESGAGNAVIGAYLRDLEFSYKAIGGMPQKGPTSVEWLPPHREREVGVAWFMLRPPRAIPIPPQQSGPRPPLDVIAAWSKLMPPPVTVSPERGNEEVRDPAPPVETVFALSGRLGGDDRTLARTEAVLRAENEQVRDFNGRRRAARRQSLIAH